MRAAVLGWLALTACEGDTGLIEIDLATAPGSTLLDGAQTLRMTITNPRRVLTAERSAGGFSLAIDLPATGESAALLVDALAADGSVLASGASPRFPLGGESGRVVVYLAAPDSIDVAPTSLDPPRVEIAVGTLAYGAILAGGAVAGGTPSDALEIYNAYDHSLLAGMPLPGPRAGLAVGVGALGVYLFGGRDETGAPDSTLWRFDPAQPPAGSYFDFGPKPGLGRAGQRFVPTGNERFLLTGAPAAELLGLDGSLVVRDDVASLPPDGVTATGNDGTTASFFAGPDGVVRCRASACDALALPGRTGASVVTLPGGKVGVVCGSSELLRIDVATGTAEPIASVPTVAKTACAVAVTSRHLVIAGGSIAGAVDGGVEIFDAATLAPVATSTLAVPRAGAVAIALPNDQVLIAGGSDAAGQPTGTLELFTPANP